MIVGKCFDAVRARARARRRTDGTVVIGRAFRGDELFAVPNLIPGVKFVFFFPPAFLQNSRAAMCSGESNRQRYCGCT